MNHDRSAERKLMDMTTMEKVAECQAFNALGNAFFEEGQYGRAALKYYRTLVYVEYVFPDTDEEDRLLEHVKFIANLNSAACKLKTRQYDEVKQHCTHALEFEPTNTKAYYRRACLHRIKDDFENAKVDIKKALELSPNDFEVRREYCRLRSKMETYERRSREIYQRCALPVPMANTGIYN
jgi:tetratricopeptide (TPR) repeat protein